MVQAVEKAGANAPRVRSGRLLVVVDYAERWNIEVLARMILDLAEEAGPGYLRVLLLARMDYGLWELIASTLDRQVDDLAAPIRLEPLFASGTLESTTAFGEAVAAFQSAMKLPLKKLAPPASPKSTDNSLLGLHMAALATVLAQNNQQTIPSGADLSEFLLTHERKYWSVGLAPVLPAVVATAEIDRVSRTVLAATLFGPLGSSADARQLLRTARLAGNDADAQSLIDRHAQLYPAEEGSGTHNTAVSPYLRPLYPDRFAEDFVAWCMRRTAGRDFVLDLLKELASGRVTDLQSRALDFLSATAIRHPFVDEVVEKLVGTSDGYVHLNSRGVPYYLHRTSVTLRGGRPQTIYFFAKVRRNRQGEPTALPRDRVVKENPRNGFLTISKKKDHAVATGM
ncbi:hypothetical protein [Microbacterium sp. BR1]|uniref:hypothetical protein n=1 Tax=Microbacterium sp. BR1 TaxID=1070896 RepID=UPI0018E1F40D|nr:hypothetical protein [Microbacterium sp. BR1]